MRSLGGVILLVDRTMALFVGLAAGAAIAFSFEGEPVESDPGRRHRPLPIRSRHAWLRPAMRPPRRGLFGT